MRTFDGTERITKLLSESDAATLGRRLAVIDDKIRGSKTRRKLILRDAESEIEELEAQIEQAIQRAKSYLKEERKKVEELADERGEIIDSLLTNVARVEAPATGRLTQAVVYNGLDTQTGENAPRPTSRLPIEERDTEDIVIE